MGSNGRVTNTDFAKVDQEFIAACAKAGIPPTKRQASRWRQKFGAAYKIANGAPVDFDGKIRIGK